MSDYEKSDIYKVSQAIYDLNKKFMPDVENDIFYMGLFGAVNENLSNIAVDSVYAATEWGNEGIPIRANLDRSILSYAISHDVSDINGIPAVMTVSLGFIESELSSRMVNNKIIIDRECPINIGGIEFHLDYDLIITKRILRDGTNAYSARYSIKRKNRLSSIKDPYLDTPITMMYNNSSFIFIKCDIRQVMLTHVYQKVQSSNYLDNKTFNFQFENQLANFTMSVKEKDTTRYLVPVFEGMPSNDSEYYCFYTYLDSNKIRVKFDRNSYEPRTSVEVDITLETTLGEDGNIIYKDEILVSLKSEKINYRNLSMVVLPNTNARGGSNRKSKTELKDIIARETLGRKIIACNKDIENYFTTIDNTKMYFYKRAHNQYEHLYYAYLLLLDSQMRIVPSNTCELELYPSDFNVINDGRYILNPGRKLQLCEDGKVRCVNVPDDKIPIIEKESFLYSSPFTMVVNDIPTVSYYLNNMNAYSLVNFSYINQDSPLQFLCLSGITCYRNYLCNNTDYIFSAEITQNINSNLGAFEEDEHGNITKINVKAFMVFENELGRFYKEADIAFDKNSYTFKLEFRLKSDNTITKNNTIKISNLKALYTSMDTTATLDRNSNISVYVYVDYAEGMYGMEGTDTYFPEHPNITLVNKYTTESPMSLFYNYTENIKSIATVEEDENQGFKFNIKGVPLFRYSYINDIDRCDDIIDILNRKKVAIDDSLNIVEDGFSVDLKCFNTYGISKQFTIGLDNEKLDRTNLSLAFTTKLYAGSDKNIINYIKEAIQDSIHNINEINSIHMNNICSYIKESYPEDIEWIQCTNINNYDSTYLYIKKGDLNDIDEVPEFINVNLNEQLNPDITIISV